MFTNAVAKQDPKGARAYINRDNRGVITKDGRRVQITVVNKITKDDSTVLEFDPKSGGVGVFAKTYLGQLKQRVQLAEKEQPGRQLADLMKSPDAGDVLDKFLAETGPRAIANKTTKKLADPVKRVHTARKRPASLVMVDPKPLMMLEDADEDSKPE